MTAPPNPRLQVEFFGPADVRLLEGEFLHAQERDVDWLLRLEPDRLLAGFREQAGLEPRAAKYGGWEAQSIAGHSLGHYLSACSFAAAQGDERFRERVAAIVAELAACQAANGDGYVSAIPDGRRIFAEVARGEIRSAGFDLNGGWVPWYTTHKVMAGLRDAYELAGCDQALGVLVALGEWCDRTTAGLTPEQIQKMLACEHGGMNEVAVDLYDLTGDAKWLALSRRFHHEAILGPLARGEDCLPGVHANTQIPKITGVARRYEETGDETDRAIAEFFWRTVIDHHTYVIGGNSSGEYFGAEDALSARLSDNTTETCNTYNMLRLTRRLFAWEPRGELMDYYERALYNHILASQNPDDGMVCYYVPLRQGAIKTYSTPFDSFWCCVGTGMENHVRYGETIYAHDADGLYVNLFIPSELTWDEAGIGLRQETRFPDDEAVKLTLSCNKPRAMALRIRRPSWAVGGADYRVNGEAVRATTGPDGYDSIERKWRDGDVVEFNLPMGLRTDPMPDKRDRIAVLYGPIVLAGAFGPEPPRPWAPVLVPGNGGVADWLEPVAGDRVEFATDGAARPEDFGLLPFHRMHHQHYSVYFDLFTRDQWQARQREYEAEQERLRALEARTVDVMRIGEMQPERDHRLEGEETFAGEHNGRKWRDARNGGWFAFDMKVLPDQPLDLLCTYWGSDSGGREFTVLVEGRAIAEETLNNDRPGEFFNRVHPIPEDLTRGRGTVRVRFQAKPGRMAGGLFGCRIVKRQE